ncbi:MAG TPA: hypothetical protein VGM34_03465 [Chlamydiales bacterium]
MTACSQSAAPWRLDSIATGDHSSDSSRLIYSTSSSHLKLEFLRIGKELFAYLFLQQHKFVPSSTNPGHVELSLTLDGIETKHFLPMRHGSMRLPLPEEIKEKLISALQDGKEVGILLNGFEQTISPSLFQERYKEFVGGTVDFFQFIKGPLK